MPKIKAAKPVEMIVTDAIEAGLSDLGELKQEISDWADNLENGNLGATPKFEEVSSCRDELDSVPEAIELEGAAGEVKVTVILHHNARKGRPDSRSLRRDNALAYLEAAKDALDSFDGGTDDDKSAAESAKDEVQEAIDAAEAAEFPGMF